MASAAPRIHVGVLVILLLSYGCFSIYSAVTERQWDLIVGGAASLVAATAVVASRRWARYIVFLVAAASILGLAWYIWLGIRSGYFGHLSPLKIVLSLAPGLLFASLALYCCYVAQKYVGVSR